MPGFWLGERAVARGYRLVGFDSVGSTSTEASRAGAAGDVGDVWFCALQQTAGRGRRGRPWETVHGNLAASLLIVLDGSAEHAATLGFVAGVALAAALSQVVTGRSANGPHIALKWPNDVLADGAKVAGILLEAHRHPSGGSFVVVGIGVNIVSAPSGLPYPATSLAMLGVDASAEQVFAALSDAWVDAFATWTRAGGVEAILARWREAAAGIGGDIAVTQDGEVVRGVFETIDSSGRLILRAPDDRRVVITAGDVHFGTTASLRK
ncbi:biotin--[acetyl-CoA-carboxylase] ligase [Devosia sp.]|uniref:biotin--[acetyl-CoA-carboxylase] ligase n=1 Tax=Devosia sp. TaxID=1871048 RepID=UPI0035AEA8AC